MSNDTVGENSVNTRPLYQQHTEYQSHYRSQKKDHPCLNINSTTLIDEVIEYYIGSMNVSCVHCNAKHFPAEKISNKGDSFHDCSRCGVFRIFASISTISS